MPNPKERLISDEDVAAIVNALEKRMTDRFYNDLGKGVWGLVWKALVVTMITIAAYGSYKGMNNG